MMKIEIYYIFYQTLRYKTIMNYTPVYPDLTYQILTPAMVVNKPKHYDEEKLQTNTLPKYVLWWNKNKDKITKYVIGTGLVFELMMISYFSVIEPISNVLTA